MTKAVIITVLGGYIEADLADYKDMQRVVGGLIEPVAFNLNKDNFDVYVNEEGILLGLPFNKPAHEFLQTVVDDETFQWVPQGDLFLLGGVDPEGESTDVPKAVAEMARVCCEQAWRS